MIYFLMKQIKKNTVTVNYRYERKKDLSTMGTGRMCQKVKSI